MKLGTQQPPGVFQIDLLLERSRAAPGNPGVILILNYKLGECNALEPGGYAFV